MQNSWYKISLWVLLVASSCLQKQKATEVRPSGQGADRDSTLAAPADVSDTPLGAKTDTVKPLPPVLPIEKTQNAPPNKKGPGTKGKEVHAPMPEKEQVKDAGRLEKERQKRKKEGKEQR